MLTFICPHCQQELRINPEHVGLRGKCNRCGGRIALIGRRDAQRPQMASQISEVGEGDARPATPRQVTVARQLGATPAQVAGLDREGAGALMKSLQDTRAQLEPPTEKQLDYLKRLGLPEAELKAITSKADASRLIDQWLPPPSQNQRDYLARLGASPEQIGALRTKSEAAALIQRYLSGMA